MFAKSGIWIVVLLLIFIISFFSTPSANAGVFSFFTDLFAGGSTSTNNEPVNLPNLQNLILPQNAVNPDPNPSKSGGDITITNNDAVMGDTGLVGTLSDVDEMPQSDRISVYEVRKGDTLAQIAKMYGVSVNTIVWGNDIAGPIKEGQILTILPISGIKYTVKKGDTLSSIAKVYKADAQEILRFNDLKMGEALAVGSSIIIPDAEVQIDSTGVIQKSGVLPEYKGYYMRPLLGGRKTQGIHGHNGIDFGVSPGTNVYAAAGGQVIIAKYSGYNGGYGEYVVINHPNGTQTVYGHLSTVMVNRGDQVYQGQVIGLSGNTGKSTGPHLHFEVRGAKNPF